MSTWTRQKLGEIAQMKYGTMPLKEKFGFGDYQIFSGYRYFDKYPISNCAKGDVIVVARGVGGTGDIKIVKNDCYLTNLSIKISLDQARVSNRYFYYKYLLKNLRYLDSGSAQSQITIDVLKDLRVDLPDLQTQNQIASVLSAYDDLIENNEKRIKALEKMAQLIYTEWFVKFKFPGHEKIKLIDSGTEYGKIPEGWEVKKLEDLMQIKKGKNITRETISAGKVPVVAGGLEPAYLHDTPNTQSPVVTISASGANAGFTRLYFEDVWASDCSFIDLSVTPFVYFYYLFLLNKQDDIYRLQRGSAQPHVYPKDLMDLKIIDPAEEMIKRFNDKVTSLFLLIRDTKQKNEALSKTRDLLIPQLITGKRELK